MSPLIKIVFLVDDQNSCKAAWVLEYVCLENVELMYPHLDFFSENIHQLHLHSAIRSVSKICMLLTEESYSECSETSREALSVQHKKRFMETTFDWMITDQKVATKALSMTTLYLLGKEFKWIYPELRSILERDYQLQSAGYKARARHILKLIRQDR